ncbi:MAG: sugar phosphate isomerase/epimerase family protein [Fimbriimonas sp.]
MTSLQNFQRKNESIENSFQAVADLGPEIELSWSNWGFGIEPLATSAARLQANGIRWIELHGNHYGADLGYRPQETLRILGDHGIKVGGICGMFSADNDLASNRGTIRQNALDYIKRTLDFCAEVGGTYLLVVPAAVGRPAKIDDAEFDRSVAALSLVADRFTELGIEGAVEPIRSAETSLCHTIAEAKRYIAAVGHPGIQGINGDVYHMQAEEAHIGEALVDAGGALVNLHLADSNRRALGEGSLDVDTVLKALYAIGFNRPGRYATPEPLGPGGDPYPAMNGKPDPAVLDALVKTTAGTWRAREAAVRASHARQ